jgi:hypothetical protein
MAFDFPNSPTVGQTYLGYVWDGLAWQVQGSAAVSGGNLNGTGFYAFRSDGYYEFILGNTSAPVHTYGWAVSSYDGSFTLDDITRGASVLVGAATGEVSISQAPPVADNSAKVPTTGWLATNGVRNDIVQTLTGPQQAQARRNIAGVGTVKVQKFTASGTYTPSPGLLYATIECVGGGGGSGGAASTSGNGAASGGGGGGGYSYKIATAALIGASLVVTVGGGGNGGAAAAGTGGNGGDTSVGALCIGKGATGSTGVPGNTPVFGGAGGVSGTGDYSIPGQNGFTALGYGINSIFSPPGGNGGTSGKGFGMGGSGGMGSVGGNGGNYGGGGGGSNSFNGTGSFAGAPGAPGIVIITEYCAT